MGDVLAVIPARFASTRFPGKPLASIAGKPLVQHVWEAARECASIGRLVVATDDERIRACVEGFGAECMMTGECESGTDRVAAVSRSFDHPVVLNVQGDEPLLRVEWLEALIAPLQQADAPEMTTLRTEITDAAELDDPNVVKVVVRHDQSALYFSRSRIPHPRATAVPSFKHIGLYGYRRDFLLRFAALPPSKLEAAESLEQLRALEAGARIMVPALRIDSIAVDRPADVGRVESFLSCRNAAKGPRASGSRANA